MQGSTTYVAVPIELVEALGLHQGVEIQRAYNPDTDCLIKCLRNDYDLFDGRR